MSEFEIRAAIRKVCEQLDLRARSAARTAVIPIVIGAGVAGMASGTACTKDDTGGGGTGAVQPLYAAPGGSGGTGADAGMGGNPVVEYGAPGGYGGNPAPDYMAPGGGGYGGSAAPEYMAPGGMGGAAAPDYMAPDGGA